MAEILRIDGSAAHDVERVSMVDAGFLETTHLEKWVQRHPAVIGAELMIVTTQFDAWESELAQARDRPDILALSNTGQLVVVELKRGRDRRVHLQAITYGALAAGFTLAELAKAHARWIHSVTGEVLTLDEARSRLTEHVDGAWSDELLQLPRLVVVAESFPPEVLTTVRWLERVAPNLVIECHEYNLFRDSSGLFAVFTRIFPIEDLSDQILRPSTRDATEDAREILSENKRRAKSVTIIHQNSLIPPGSQMTLRLTGVVRTELAGPVVEWMAGDAARSDVSWVDDPVRPLTWAAADDPLKHWTPSALRNEIFEQAVGEAPTFSAADAWCYEDRSLYVIAESVDSDDRA